MINWEQITVPALIAAAGGFLAWIASYSQSRARQSVMEAQFEETRKNMYIQIGDLRDKLAASVKDRENLHDWIDRIDRSKASIDSVSGLTANIADLKSEIRDIRTAVNRIESAVTHKP